MLTWIMKLSVMVYTWILSRNIVNILLSDLLWNKKFDIIFMKIVTVNFVHCVWWIDWLMPVLVFCTDLVEQPYRHVQYQVMGTRLCNCWYSAMAASKHGWWCVHCVRTRRIKPWQFELVWCSTGQTASTKVFFSINNELNHSVNGFASSWKLYLLAKPTRTPHGEPELSYTTA